MTSKKIELEKPYLTTKKLFPENQETPIHFIREWATPEEYFYIRNHFLYPHIPDDAFQLEILGDVERPIVFTYGELKAMPSKSMMTTIECAGNKRSYFEPRVFGEQWKDGAISQGIWRGVSLRYLLSMTGLNNSALEVVFEGYDEGERTDMEGVFPFARSLPLDKALHPDTIIAYEYNGKPISYAHGYPLRLVVPQWYGMASVKWLKYIKVIDHPFQGPFQVVDYVYYPFKDTDEGRQPVTDINVNSIIQQPLDYSILDTGKHQIYGIAWTGRGKIDEVEISIDNGNTWNKTLLQQDKEEPYAWTFWSYTWEVYAPGEYKIKVRAKDINGRIQPTEAEWNRKGYGYNAVVTINVKIE